MYIGSSLPPCGEIDKIFNEERKLFSGLDDNHKQLVEEAIDGTKNRIIDIEKPIPRKNHYKYNMQKYMLHRTLGIEEPSSTKRKLLI